MFVVEHVRRHWLAGSWAIWGKLPSQGDFLCHRTTAAQARGWQDWVHREWSQRPGAQHAQQRHAKAGSEAGRMALAPHATRMDLADLPVAFVMQPGSLPFSPGHCVRGVVVASSDQSGRPCPLIFFQLVAPPWLRRSWRQHSSLQPDDDVLYWLGRVAARAHAAGDEWHALVSCVDTLDERFRCDARHWFGRPLPAPSRQELDALLHGHGVGEAIDPATNLQGVTHMPWADWPDPVVRTRKPANAFWQQDARGGCINAGENLHQLGGGAA
jgi:type VI secretion system protein ImpM